MRKLDPFRSQDTRNGGSSESVRRILFGTIETELIRVLERLTRELITDRNRRWKALRRTHPRVFNRFSVQVLRQVRSPVVERFYTASFVFRPGTGPIPDNDKTLIWPLMKFTIAGNGDLAAPCVTYFFRSPQNYAFDQLNAADLQPSTDAQKRILFSELIYIYIFVYVFLYVFVRMCVCVVSRETSKRTFACGF